jgi:hypothetical protein
MSQDFLRECMSDPALVQGQVPIDEFNKAYCVRCVQKECARAGLNGSLLARRAATWHTNLFEKPPRAAEDDPRYQSIRAKKFLQTSSEVVELRNNGVNYEVQTREMPEALRKNPPEPPAFDPPPPAPVWAAEPVPPAPEPVQAIPEPVLDAPSVPPAVSAPPVRPVDAPPQNTPFEQGTVLPGGSSEKTVEVGGSYVFGSDE